MNSETWKMAGVDDASQAPSARKRRNVTIATTARSDYSSCLPILQAIKSDPELDLRLIVSGAHLSPEFGLSAEQIEGDGFRIDDRIDMPMASQTPEHIAKSVGAGTVGFAESFRKFSPDLLLVVGDRFELLSIATAALPFLIPLAHVSGGDVTEGATDNQVRFAMSKLSHLHFVAMPSHAQRLIQLGEEAWRVHVTGDPALDLIRQMEFLPRAQLSDLLGLGLKPPVILVTLHPATLSDETPKEQTEQLLKALQDIPGCLVFSHPNADAESRVIADMFREFAAARPEAGFFLNLSQHKYYNLMAVADLMVGNSSSGIWEAPSFRLPVVNIGERQRGRERARNVIDVDVDAGAIQAAILKTLDPAFRESLAGMTNPYGNGYAARTIVDVIKTVPLGTRLLQKKFVDLSCDPAIDEETA